MHILTIIPAGRTLTISAFRDGSSEPFVHRQFNQNRSILDFGETGTGTAFISSVGSALDEAGLLPLDLIAVRGVYGGPRLAHPVLATESVLEELADLAPQSPLHLPHLIQLVKAVQGQFLETPVGLIFETSFFVPLPEREWRYGIDLELLDSQLLRRFGYHGIFHESACLDAKRQLRLPVPRVLSICLEPRPELAACRGRRPVMVTGGSTPVEGLPGETSSGDLDPSVVLKLADDGHWGPEGTSHLLTCESGLRGLTGRDISLAGLLESSEEELQPARDVFLHSVLRACGAGIAALGGLDAIIYSGRYVQWAPVLHEWLNERLQVTLQRETTCLIHSRTLPQNLRDMACVLARENRVCPDTI